MEATRTGWSRVPEAWLVHVAPPFSGECGDCFLKIEKGWEVVFLNRDKPRHTERCSDCSGTARGISSCSSAMRCLLRYSERLETVGELL